MDRLLSIYHLGVKELFSLRRDAVLMALVIWAFTFSIYTAATGMSHDLRNAAIAIVDEIARFTVLKKVSLAANRSLTSDGWKTILQHLSPSVEDLDLEDCSLDDVQAIAIGDAIGPFTILKKVSLADNEILTRDGWKTLLQNLSPSVEDLNLRDCGLNDDKAIAIGDEIARFTLLKKVSLAHNYIPSPDGWKAMLQNLSPSVDDLDLDRCQLDDGKAIAIGDAIGRLAPLSHLNIDENKNLSAHACQSLEQLVAVGQ